MPILNDRRFCQLVGVQQARAQWRRFPVAVREAVADATEKTAKLIVVRARALAPVRKDKEPGYAGGALRDHIGYDLDKVTGTASVGIRRGLLVAHGGRLTAVTRLRYGQRAKLVERGRRRGQYVKTGYRMLLRNEERDKVRAAGGVIIQPTKYGHFAEFGRGGPRHGARTHPFITPAVTQSQDYFLTQMRAGAKTVEADLKALGLRG